jgi:NAD(P)-dependent dehydrogenase (short-subunit alcohol dehydrogenase family)
MIEKEFDEGVALVLGGSGGIGAAITELFAARGTDVAFTYLSNKERADKVLQRLQKYDVAVNQYQLSLEEPDAIDAVLGELKETFGKIHSIVYASGPNIQVGYVSKITRENWERVFREDTHSCFNLVHAAVPVLQAQGGGSLTAVTTTQFHRPELMGVLSAAPKAAIEMTFRAIAKESAPFGVRANIVRSGWVNAGMIDDSMGGQLEDKHYQALISQIPMKRFANPYEVAEAAVFMASNRAGFITGMSITADGGMHL